MGTEQSAGNRFITQWRAYIETNPYDDPNTLIEQSASLNYSNRTFITSLGNHFEKSWIRHWRIYSLQDVHVYILPFKHVLLLLDWLDTAQLNI